MPMLAARMAAWSPRSSASPGRTAQVRVSPLARKLGHLVFTWFIATTVSAETRQLLGDVGVGGMIIHSGNVHSRNQLLALTRSLRRSTGGSSCR
jgi:hypothetical protein